MWYICERWTNTLCCFWFNFLGKETASFSLDIWGTKPFFFMLLNLISFCDFVAVVIAVNFKLIVFIYLFSLISVRHLHILLSLLDASLFLTFFSAKASFLPKLQNTFRYLRFSFHFSLTSIILHVSSAKWIVGEIIQHSFKKVQFWLITPF